MTEKEDALLNIIHGFTRLNISPALHVVTQGEFFVIWMIRQLGGYSKDSSGSVNVSRLAEVLDVSPAAVSRTLKGLEERNLLDRVIDPDNRRNTLITLTESGRQLFSTENKEIEELVRRVYSRMGESDMKTLCGLSTKLHDILIQEIDTCALAARV